MLRTLLISTFLALPLAAQVVPFFSPVALRPGGRTAEITKVTDLNGDGLPDFITFRSLGLENKIESQLNSGDGFFAPITVVDADFYDVYTMEVADLNGDGRPDLAAGSSSSSTGIRIYLNNGSGLVESQRFTDFNTNTLFFADIDKDGRQDLVYQSNNSAFNSPAVKWRPNQGDGSFGAERVISTIFARKIAVADIDGDNDTDVVTLQSMANTIVWYPNAGNGSFGSPRSIEGNLSNQYRIEVADVDNDGDRDLAVNAGEQIYLYRNNGSGGFSRATLTSATGTVDFLKFVRADADALPDLVYESNTLAKYRKNLGSGRFGAEEALPVPNSDFSLRDVVIVDYDKDGLEDIVSTHWGNDYNYLHRNGLNSPPNIVSFATADNTVDAGAPATLTWKTEGANTLRIDGNLVTGASLTVTPGALDKTYTLTATNAAGTSTAKVSIFVSDPVFAAQSTLITQTGSGYNFSGIDAADINGDGRTDVAFVSTNDRQAGWYAATGATSFGTQRIVASNVDQAAGILLCDVDKDGDKDLIIGHSAGANLYRNNGSGTFGTAISISNLRCTSFSEVDMNRDGWPDLLLMDYNFQPVRLAMNDGTGNFPTNVTVSNGAAHAALAADVDKDGILDLLISSETAVRLNRGTSATTFLPSELVTSDGDGGALFYNDLDQDGYGDVVVKGSRLGGPYGITVIFGRARGTFASTSTVLTVNSLSSLAAADFDGDLDLDLGFVSTASTRFAGWIEGDGLGKFSEVFTTSTLPSDSYQVLARDMDKDGDLDLLASSSGRIFWMKNITEHATPPVLGSLQVSETLVHRGESVDLTWDATGGKYLSVSISPGPGTVTGNKVTVTPTETTTYTISATNRGGTVTSQVTVTVVDRPLIRSFVSNLNDVDRTTPITLSWQVAGADQLSISPGVGTVSGSSVTTPVYQTTTYTLTATNEHGSDTREVRVEVDPTLFRFAAGIAGPASMSPPRVQQVADFDGDGRLDVVAGSLTSSGTGKGQIYVVRSLGNGSFATPQVVQNNIQDGINDIAVADFDGDGRSDFATCSGMIDQGSPTGSLQWVKSQGSSWQISPITPGGENLTSLHAVDWDLDGKPDLLGSSPRLGRVVWFRNLGNGSFAPRANLGGSFAEVTRISSADIDGDHDPDLIIAQDTTLADLIALINKGDGTFEEQRALIPRGNVRFFDFGDLDGDGDLDLVATSLDRDRCERFLNDGTGHFGEGLRLIPTNQVGSGIRLGDVDSDGDLDVVWLNGTYKWSENLGNGSFQNETPDTIFGHALYGMPFLGDFDGDGDLDAIGKSEEEGFHLSWFRNLSTPPTAAPVIDIFAASDAVILPGKRLGLNWSVKGFPTSLEIVPGVQSTPIALIQGAATITSVATATETVQSYTLIARNIVGETRRELSFRVGNPPEIRAFAHSPALVNQGETASLTWDIVRADSLGLAGTGDVTGKTEITLVPGTAPFTTYEITATNIFGSSTATTTVEVNRPPSATPLAPFTANAAGDPLLVETAPVFSDPDSTDHLTWTLVGNTLPAIFSSLAIDSTTGRLQGSFTPFIDGESLLTLRGTDRNGLFADTTLLVTLPRVPDPALGVTDQMTLNRQTGLYEQIIRITNSGGRSIGGFIIEIAGLPEGVTIQGMPAPAAGQPYRITFAQAVAAGATTEFKVEYFSSRRSNTAFSPTISVTQVARPDQVAPPQGDTFQVEKIIPLADGSILLEWESVPGKRYQVEYSGSGTEWITSTGVVTASSNRLQWIDQGPPKTLTHPSQSGTRLYRVVELQGQ